MRYFVCRIYRRDLYDVNCSYRNLTSLSELPINPSRVNSLKLDGTPNLQITSSSFTNFSSLVRLSLPDSSIPYDNPQLFSANKRLVELNATGTVVNVSNSLFSTTPQLKHLRGLSVKLFPKGLFSSLRRLQILHIETEQKSLDGHMLSGTALQQLRLAANNVKSLPDNLLKPVSKSLEHLYLRAYQLTSLPQNFLANAATLKYLNIDAPRISITCPLFNLEIYNTEVVISAAHMFDACVFDNITAIGEIQLNDVDNVVCAMNIKQASQYKTLAITNSGITEFTGNYICHGLDHVCRAC